MQILRNCVRAAVVFCVVSTLVAVAAFGRILFLGKYNGVVIFDRWDACYLYSGVNLMPISEAVKESVRAYRGQAVLIDVQDMYRRMNPGDALIKKLQVLGPAEDITPAHTAKPPIVEGLSLRAMPNFPAQGADELIIELRNDGDTRREIDTNQLAPTLLARKQGPECPIEPADGPSYAAVTSASVAFLHRGWAGGSCGARTAKLSLATGAAVADRFDLDPGQSTEVSLRFELSPGEYEFLAGYGGGFHMARPLVSNQFGFDVDDAGKAHLAKGALVSNQARPPRRVGAVCGRVTLEDGNPAVRARVLLWPFPVAKFQPRAANTTVADGDGRFRMEAVPEGKYALTARSDSGGVLAGVVGGRRLADGAALSLPEASEGCSLSVTVHPQPGFTVRGRTEAAGPSSGARTARLIMTGGDAIPFETIAVVQPDGRYEFRDVPPGWYQFDAGQTGSGFEVRSDIDDLGVEIHWSGAGNGATGGRFAGNGGEAMVSQFDEVMAAMTLQRLHDAQRSYKNTYKAGFAKNLTLLGPPPAWYRPSADHAGLVNEIDARLLAEGDGTQCTQDGYRVAYLPGPPDDKGEISTYTLSARPVQFGKTGNRSFLVDESGAVHATKADRPATREDQVFDLTQLTLDQ